MACPVACTSSTCTLLEVSAPVRKPVAVIGTGHVSFAPPPKPAKPNRTAPVINFHPTGGYNNTTSPAPRGWPTRPVQTLRGARAHPVRASGAAVLRAKNFERARGQRAPTAPPPPTAFPRPRGPLPPSLPRRLGREAAPPLAVRARGHRSPRGARRRRRRRRRRSIAWGVGAGAGAGAA
eukprot:scaffold1594_cov401-Prasinococcus_capsulatus_cf.AAC.29